MSATKVPYEEWHETFTSSILIPSGIDHCDPKLIADLVTRFLVCMQLMNKDAYQAGYSDAKIPGAHSE